MFKKRKSACYGPDIEPEARQVLIVMAQPMPSRSPQHSRTGRYMNSYHWLLHGSKLKSLPSAKSHHVLLVKINISCFSYQMHTNIWDLRPSYIHKGASLVAQMVKNPQAMQETWIQSLGREDPLEKGIATHSSILAWGIPLTEEPDRLQSRGPQKAEHDWAIHRHIHA